MLDKEPNSLGEFNQGELPVKKWEPSDLPSLSTSNKNQDGPNNGTEIKAKPLDNPKCSTIRGIII